MCHIWRRLACHCRLYGHSTENHTAWEKYKAVSTIEQRRVYLTAWVGFRVSAYFSWSFSKCKYKRTVVSDSTTVQINLFIVYRNMCKQDVSHSSLLTISCLSPCAINLECTHFFLMSLSNNCLNVLCKIRNPWGRICSLSAFSHIVVLLWAFFAFFLMIWSHVTSCSAVYWSDCQEVC